MVFIKINMFIQKKIYFKKNHIMGAENFNGVQNMKKRQILI